ncbi:hypothetical protein DRN38_01815 [Thermococci archaeon]|nr:MAG: hypothetical protein DRN38_01815 [Thermococci archaeon]
MPEDILTPKERYDSLVFIGIKENDVIDFIKVYAEDKTKALALLNSFFYEKGIHPMDFIVVDEGVEDVSEKEIISTKTEEELSAYLSRLGLKLISNGILYTKYKDSIYQITAISRELYETLKKQKKPERMEEELKEVEPYIDLEKIPAGEIPKEYIKQFNLLNLMQDMLVINEAEIDLETILKEAIQGQVLIPRNIEVEESLLIQIFDKEYHREISSAVDKVLVKTPIIYWDYYVDSMDDFEFKKIEERVFSAPIFLKAMKGFLVLYEPPKQLVKRLRRIKKRGYVDFNFRDRRYKIPVNFTIIVETGGDGREWNMTFPITMRLPKLDEHIWLNLIREEFGVKLSIADARRIPKDQRTMSSFKNLKILYRKLKEHNKEKGDVELLKEAIDIMVGTVR